MQRNVSMIPVGSLWVGLGGPMTHLEMLAWWAFWVGELCGVGRRSFLMGHGLGVSWDVGFWLHTVVFLDPGPGLGGRVP